MSLKITVPYHDDLSPKITVFGVGGAGGNAVNNMIEFNLQGVQFCSANTDSQVLEHSKAEHKIKLGISTTKGLGAGSYPEVGKAAAEESTDEILGVIGDSNMVFITAGMGGGTGTGAAPVVAKLAKERGILTIGVVTKPFHFEGARRMKIAELGIEDLEKYVDTLIIVPNQNLFRIANESTTFAGAFKMADDVLHSGVRGVTDLITMPGLINLDFADIKTIMSEKGKAMMGTGEAEGEERAIRAAEAAISNPLLDNSSMKGARGVLINITGGEDMTLYEVDEAANVVKSQVDADANIIFGSAFNKELDGKLRVSIFATGIDKKFPESISEKRPYQYTQHNKEPEIEQIIIKPQENSIKDEDQDTLAFNPKETIDPESATTKYPEDEQLKQEQEKKSIFQDSAYWGEPKQPSHIQKQGEFGFDIFDTPAFLRKKSDK